LRERAHDAPLDVIVVHAKAGRGAADWETRRRLAEGLGARLDALGVANAIVLGDFNDEIERSLADDRPSPYRPWLERSGWTVPTRRLEAPMAEHSTAWGDQLDHIALAPALGALLWPASVDVLRDELADAGDAFPARVSDHFPVRLRMSPPERAR